MNINILLVLTWSFSLIANILYKFIKTKKIKEKVKYNKDVLEIHSTRTSNNIWKKRHDAGQEK
jgi:hypothetical protein